MFACYIVRIFIYLITRSDLRGAIIAVKSKGKPLRDRISPNRVRPSRYETFSLLPSPVVIEELVARFGFLGVVARSPCCETHGDLIRSTGFYDGLVSYRDSFGLLAQAPLFMSLLPLGRVKCQALFPLCKFLSGWSLVARSGFSVVVTFDGGCFGLPVPGLSLVLLSSMVPIAFLTCYGFIWCGEV
ncbi:unnamed protein product [Arabis nemorensis]|uniref:Uncharacterized protein n=1 Tax=Arabis nemorensis TaxID=586526 RepID=A0A565BGU1_9BRAS|nr:unnamed protein product [Arabis nemorensis]